MNKSYKMMNKKSYKRLLAIGCFLIFTSCMVNQNEIHTYPVQSENQNIVTEPILPEPVPSIPQEKEVPIDPYIANLFGNEAESKGDIIVSLSLVSSDKKHNKTLGLTYIKDSISNKLTESNFKVLESENIQTDFLLSGTVTSNSFPTADGTFVAELLIYDFKLTSLYWFGQNAERAALLSVPSIDAHQESDNETTAMKMATLQVMTKLEKIKLFEKMTSYPMLNRLKKGGWLFKTQYTKPDVSSIDKVDIDNLEKRLTTKIVGVYERISGVQESNKKNLEAFQKDIAKKVRDMIAKAPVKVIKEKNVIREKPIIMVSKEGIEKLAYKQATGIIIKVTGDFTPTPVTNIIGYGKTISAVKKTIKKQDLDEKKQNDICGKKPFEINASAKGNDIELTPEDADKFYRLRHYKLELFDSRILVVY